MSQAARRDPRVRLLLVGDGPLRPAIERQIAKVGLGDRAVLVGRPRDVPRLMLGAMDTVLFPSLFDGLGLVLIEAQAAGLPRLLSSNIPKEADVVTPLIHRRSLSDAAANWAKAILNIREAGSQIAQPEALALITQSAFNIRTAVRELEALYRTCVQRAAWC